MRLAGDSGGEIGWGLGRRDWLGTREARLAWGLGKRDRLGTREARSADLIFMKVSIPVSS